MTLTDDLFLRDPKHREALERGELPRERLDPVGLVALVFFASVFIIVGGLGVWGGAQELRDGAALERGGQRVEAAQTARRTAEGKRRSYHITYTYMVAGQRYEREGRASLTEWERFCEGCAISARYAADDPATSRLDAEWPLVNGGGMAAIMGAILLLGLGLIASWLQSEHDRRRLNDKRSASALRFGAALDVTTHEGRASAVTLRYKLDGEDAPRDLEWQGSTRRKALPASGARLAFAHAPDDTFELL